MDDLAVDQVNDAAHDAQHVADVALEGGEAIVQGVDGDGLVGLLGDELGDWKCRRRGIYIECWRLERTYIAPALLKNTTL